MHVLPRVAELEDRFGDALAVVGVHTGKFTEEHYTPNIRHACARLDVRHPVVNDRHARIWRSYAVQAWPTIGLVTPEGYVAGVQAGEFSTDQIAEVIGNIVDESQAAGSLARGPLDLGTDPEALPEPAGVLRYPERVITDGTTMYVSDTGHKRVLELRLEGDIAHPVRAFGSGTAGYRDGTASEARFEEPLGLALGVGELFVADRRSHTVRSIDLASGDVRTIAGTGELALMEVREGHARSESLRSPWGLALAGSRLYVTMAGSHQLWAIDLGHAEPTLERVAGTGGEAVMDGSRWDAAMAQPTGVVTQGDGVYVADSESSAVRRVDDTPHGRIDTLVGTGLFDFGYRDGTGDDALLQHDLDLTVADGAVLVADTYNNRIRRIDPAMRTCTTLRGEAGSGEGLYEPAGIFAAKDGTVLVADTNHHRIVRLDPMTGALHEIEIRG